MIGFGLPRQLCGLPRNAPHPIQAQDHHRQLAKRAVELLKGERGNITIALDEVVGRDIVAVALASGSSRVPGSTVRAQGGIYVVAQRSTSGACRSQTRVAGDDRTTCGHSAESLRAAQAAHDDQPQPVPSPIKAILPIPVTDFHIQAPGPPTLKLPFSGAIPQGLNFDPSAITDFKGFSALAYPAGAARGSDGITYNLEGDMRFFTGKYKPAIGQVREGTFCFV